MVPGLLLKLDGGRWLKRTVSALRVLGSMALAGAWVGGIGSHIIQMSVLMCHGGRTHLLDSNIIELAKSPVDVRADWHGVRIFRDGSWPS